MPNTKFDFSKKHRFTQLLNELNNKNCLIEDWVKIMARLYSEKEMTTDTKNYSFFAREANDLRAFRQKTENYSQLSVSLVMITAILIPPITLAASTIIGGAALSLTLLNGVYNLWHGVDLDPILSFSKAPLILTSENRTEWSAYRDRWWKDMENHELSISNKQKKLLVMCIATTTVLSFAAGIALFSHAVSVILVLSLAAYAVSLLLSSVSHKKPLIEKCDPLPKFEFSNATLDQDSQLDVEERNTLDNPSP